jgi:alpha-1,2-mannosyltransferase
VSVAARLAALLAVWVAAWCVAFLLAPKSPVHGFFDLHVYRGAIAGWFDGRSLYSFQLGRAAYGFTYPPFAGLVLAPVAWLSSGTADLLSIAASAAVVVVVTAWLVVAVARRHGWNRWFAVALALPLVLALEPVRETLGYGQLNMLILALVLADVVALRRGRAWAGAGIGLATAIKLTPGLFIVFLLLVGRRRAGAVAAGTFLGATLLGFVADRTISWFYWTYEVWDTARVGRLDKPSNQSLLGLLAHLADPGPPDHRVWLVLAGATLVLGMWRAVWAYRRGDDLVAVTLVGLTTCLISPISWTHHLYWVVPALVVLVDVATGAPLHPGASAAVRRRPRVTAAAAAVVALVVAVPLFLGLPWDFMPRPGDPPMGVWTVILGRNAYTCLLLALLVLLPVRAAGATSVAPYAARTTAQSRPAGWSPR